MRDYKCILLRDYTCKPLWQLLRESVPASVRRFRELGLNNKMHGPKFHSAAAEKFMQLCFRSLSYGVHSFDTCLLLEQVMRICSPRPATHPMHKHAPIT
jgi:hypothetical protein